MVPNSNLLLGHLPLLSDDDFRKVLKIFSVDHVDEDGRCCFWMGPTLRALTVTRSQDVQYFLKQSSHRMLFSLMGVHNERFLGNRNIGVLNGREWKRQRAFVVRALHAAANLSETHEAVVHATKVLVSSLSSKLTKSGTNSMELEVFSTMKMLSFDIFGETALHTSFECCKNLSISPILKSFEFLANEFSRRLSTGILIPSSHIYNLPTPRNLEHSKHRKFMRNFVAEIIANRQTLLGKDGCPQDLLTELVKSREQEGDDDLAADTLADTLFSLLFAGYETSAVTLTYVLYMLSQYPEVERRCLGEIKRVKTNNPKDYVFLRAVIDETLRLYPPAVSTTRNLEKDVEIDGGVKVPKGTYLYFPIWTIQRDERNFPNPLDFIPDRWMPNGNGNRDALIAFSAGARSCPGQRFAMAELTLSLATLLESFSFSVNEGQDLTPHRESLVQSPKGGLQMKIHKRSL